MKIDCGESNWGKRGPSYAERKNAKYFTSEEENGRKPKLYN